MILQYILDGKGKTTGVFIPIEEWNSLKEKYSELNNTDVYITESQKNTVRERLLEYKKNPNQVLDLEETLDEIENNL